MKTNLIKLLTITTFALTAFAMMNINTNTTRVLAKDDDPATIYKTKCAACHGPTAAKSYDPAMPIDEQVNIILKGKKGEKPPFMPAFETKTPPVTPEQAKALAEYMKALRTPAS